MRRKALTVIELLVAISVVTLLIAMLIPAVQFGREQSRRTQCTSQLRQLALGIHAFHATTNRFPSGSTTAISNLQFRHGTWLLDILPYLEQQGIYDQAKQEYRKQPNPFSPYPHRSLSLPVSIFACPSDGAAPGPNETYNSYMVAVTSYVGCLGTDHERKDGMLIADSQLTFANIKDGSSNTLLIGERPASKDFWFGWWYAGVGQKGEGSPNAILGVNEINNSYLQSCTSGPYQFVAPSTNEKCSALHFWSAHSGGANFAFADGSVHFIAYEGADVLRLLATRAGGEVSELPK